MRWWESAGGVVKKSGWRWQWEGEGYGYKKKKKICGMVVVVDILC